MLQWIDSQEIYVSIEPTSLLLEQNHTVWKIVTDCSFSCSNWFQKMQNKPISHWKQSLLSPISQIIFTCTCRNVLTSTQSMNFCLARQSLIYYLLYHYNIVSTNFSSIILWLKKCKWLHNCFSKGYCYFTYVLYFTGNSNPSLCVYSTKYHVLYYNCTHRNNDMLSQFSLQRGNLCRDFSCHIISVEWLISTTFKTKYLRSKHYCSKIVKYNEKPWQK